MNFISLDNLFRGLKQTLKPCRRVVLLKPITSVPWVGMFFVRMFQKVLTVLIYLDLHSQFPN